MRDKHIGCCFSLVCMLLSTWVIIYGVNMSYKSVELEQAYDKLEDQYWELIDYLKAHAPATLQAFKVREQHVEHTMRRSS